MKAPWVSYEHIRSYRGWPLTDVANYFEMAHRFVGQSIAMLKIEQTNQTNFLSIIITIQMLLR